MGLIAMSSHNILASTNVLSVVGALGQTKGPKSILNICTESDNTTSNSIKSTSDTDTDDDKNYSEETNSETEEPKVKE